MKLWKLFTSVERGVTSNDTACLDGIPWDRRTPNSSSGVALVPSVLAPVCFILYINGCLLETYCEAVFHIKIGYRIKRHYGAETIQ